MYFGDFEVGAWNTLSADLLIELLRNVGSSDVLSSD